MSWLEDNATAIANRIWQRMVPDDLGNENASLKVRSQSDTVMFRFEEGSGSNEVLIRKDGPIVESRDIDIVCDLVITVAAARINAIRWVDDA